MSGMNHSMAVMTSSASDDWWTPQPLFDALNAEFGFEVDVCASARNHKCPRYWTRDDDGLAQDWSGLTCWMNPPYGRTIGDWMCKAYESSLQGATVVCLVPARVDAAWWHDYAVKGEIRFIRGRLRFANADNRAPFPSAIVVFRPDANASVEYRPFSRSVRGMGSVSSMQLPLFDAEASA